MINGFVSHGYCLGFESFFRFTQVLQLFHPGVTFVSPWCYEHQTLVKRKKDSNKDSKYSTCAKLILRYFFLFIHTCRQAAIILLFSCLVAGYSFVFVRDNLFVRP